MDLQTLTHPYTPGAAAGPESYLLVWDAPNLDMGLGAILGGLVVKIGSQMIDSSIRTRLNSLALAMKG